jgi:hypothetical protein
MTNLELKQKWSGLSENEITSGYKSVLLSTDCICDLFIGVNNEGNRCLILTLPANKNLDFKRTQKKNLIIEYFSKKNIIVLQLADNEYFDLFDDLIFSLYQGIKDINCVDEYSSYFIQTTHRWIELFEDKKSDLLSEDEIKGLIGELLVLKVLITEPNRPEINVVLNSWKGPYGRGNDFELETKNIEVKAKSQSGIDIKISSEFQLDISSGKGLELLVVSLMDDFTEGKTIKEIVFEVKELVQESSGDNAILWKALSQKNITSKNISKYDIYRFKPVSLISYNCALEGFPLLNKSNIPAPISDVKYKLRTNLLTNYIIEKKYF